MTHPVKWFTSAMPGAPRCSGTPGDLVTLLDACLLNGFNVNGMTSLEVAGGIATATFGTAHGYLQHQIVLIAGASPAQLNGEKRVLTTDTYTITFDATGLTDQTATGTINARTAPVGSWEKTYEATQKGAYRSTDLDATGLFLRVDDTGTYDGVVTAYESMTDIDTGVGWGSVYYWKKSSLADTTARDWALVADARMVYFFAKANGVQHEASWFGDIQSYKPADAYHAIVGGNKTPNTFFGYFADCANGVTNDAHLCRSYTQTGGAVESTKYGSKRSDYMGRGGEVYPSPLTGGVIAHSPVVIKEISANITRGHLPGIYQPLQANPLTDYAVTVMTSGQMILPVSLNIFNFVGETVQVFVDLDNWR